MPRRRSTKDERSWGQLFASEARRFHEDEEGATLVFAAATFFALAMSIAFVFQVGTISADRLQAQGAADAAAYSGALVQANSLNAIGQINDGITYVNYIALRHAIDGVVYSITLKQYTLRDRSPAATGSHGYVIMGGDEDEGNARIRHVERDFKIWDSGGTIRRLQDTLRWRMELYYAGVTVLSSTPGLVRSTAAEVAAANGASHIGFSDDMVRAWQLGDSEDEGFTDRGYVDDDNKYVPSMYERYEGRRVMQLDKASSNSSSAAERELPRKGWFDKTEGTFETGSDKAYMQIRLCWRKEDWEHGQSSGDHRSSPYERYRRGDAPNAHWHHPHAHSGTNPTDGTSEIPFALPHVGGSGIFLDKGGHSDEDQKVHSPTFLGPVHPNDPWRRQPNFEHHAVYPCTNCNPPGNRNPDLSPSPQGNSSRYAEIMASSARTGLDSLMNSLNDLVNQKVTPYRNGTERLQGPFSIRESLLRSGVTVMTYRRGRGLGSLFPESPWGMVAVASAQIGVETDNGVTPLRSVSGGLAEYVDVSGVPYWANSGGRNDASDRAQNLFYDVPANATRGPGLRPNERSGFHFSARLVPIARKLTWHKQNEDGAGLRQLFRAGRWFKAGKLAPNARPNAGDRPPIDSLGDFLQVNSRQDLEAFWH